MNVDGTIYKTVFFLGAGASRGAVPHVLLNQKRIKPPLNGDFFKIAGVYARACGRNSQAQGRLNRLQTVFKRDLPAKNVTMEEAFSLLYVAKDLPEIYNRRRGRRPVAGVRKEISDFLNLLFPILTLLDEESRVPTAYDRMASKLTDGDTVITLNYDTMVDSALYRRGWNPRKGYSITGNTDRKVSWKIPEFQPPLQVDLLKLHGSTNWFVRGSESNLKKIFESKPVKITRPRSKGMKGFIRQIAPPIYGKIFEHPHWQRIWTKAFEAMRDAEIVVVVGCSLIDTDFHLRALLSQVALSRKESGKKFAYACFVDKTKVRNKWQRALRGSYSRAETDNSFEKFLKKRLGV